MRFAPCSPVSRSNETTANVLVTGATGRCGRKKQWRPEPPLLLISGMSPDKISQANSELRHKTPLEIVRWAIAQVNGQAMVSTNFRPYEAVILHFCVQVQADIPVLWVDHGYNRQATYQHAEQLRKLLKLN